MDKHTGHENEGSDQQKQTVLMFKQILPTCIIKRDMKGSEENVHYDIGD